MDSSRAKQSAVDFFSALTDASSEQLLSAGVSVAYRAYSDGTANGQDSTVCFYVVNVGPKGFVMLSGDDRFAPVLGYSYESSFKAKDIPENLKGWLDGKRKEIAYALAMADFVAVPEITEQWNHLSEIGAALSVEVQPLLQTTWDQNAYYNQYCPADPNGPNGHVYAGCVATAMAQIVRYWEWPWSGFNSHSYSCDYGTLSVDFSSASYNYNNMPNSINGNSSTIQRDAVATLTYHCGVSVDMDYSSDGSGAASYDVMAALVHYFAYPSEMSYRSKSNYTSVEWNNLLRNELNNSRPVLYSGQGTGGHAFVCDGYDNNGSYHFNWGWSGYFNGYYALNALIPSSGSYSPGYNFTDDQEAIFGISAVGAFLRCSQNSLNVSAPIGGSSAVKTVDVRGHSLSGNITVTAGNGFMIGVDGSTFSNSVTMPAQGGRLYLRYMPTLSSAGNQNANVILASGTVRDTVFCLGTAIEPVCLPPQNLTGTHTGSQVNLSWSEPVDYGNGPAAVNLSWDSTVQGMNASVGSDMTLCMMQRFDVNDLTPYNQYVLDAISFIPAAHGTSFRLVVYKGGNYINGYNPGTQIVNQEVPASSLTRGTWNTVPLNSPVLVDVTEELWFGFVVYTTGNNGNVIRFSTGTYVPNKGSVCGISNGYNDGTGYFYWTDLTNSNFPIKGRLEQLSTDGLHYDVYRQASLIGSTTSTSYTDGSPLSHDCEYTVSAVWGGGCSQSASVTVEAPSVPSVSYGDTTAIACESFDWYEHTNINVSGEYIHTFVGGSASGGDSVVTLHLTVHHPDVVMIDSTICESELPFIWNGATFTEADTQTVTLTNAVGCDSIVTMHLTVNNLVTELLEDTACNSYTWNDSTYYESGEYVQHFQTSYGCDSVVTLHLTLYYDTFTDWTDTACEIFTWNDSIYVVSGDYVQHFETVHGCDSVVTFHLTLYCCTFTDWTDTTCDTYTWNDSTYVVSGDYVQRFETVHGCDSIVTLHLYLHYSVTTELDSTVCTASLPLIWNGITFTEPGTQTVTLDNIYGCDSVVVMTLNVSDYCGPVIDEKSCPGHETVTDYDGNVYATVQIGGQCWMRENLKTTHYADGTTIDTVYSITEPCRFAPGSDISNVSTYGYLYNWYAVMKSESSSDATPSNVQGICPYGWHVPSDAEWIQLTDYISSQSQFQCDDANTYIAKALAATTEWQNSDILCTPGSNQGQNNTSGFNVLPAGFSLLGGGVNFGYEAYLWSATSNVSYSNSFAYNRHLNHSNSGVSRDAHDMSFAFSVRCLRDEGQSLYFPAVTTNSVSVLTTTTATGGGTVTALNGVEVMECGVCWSINHNPTVADAITTDANCTGSFTSSLTGLSSNFVYYVRAYATNQYGTVYGEEVSFMTPVNINGDELSCPGTPILTDFDGNVYNTVQIGEQCWMRENLRTTKYADGVAITKGNGNSNTIGYWFYPNNDTANKQTYGLLYNWSAVMYGSSSSNNNPSGVQGICPDGWHVPSNTEWIELQNYVGTQSQYRCNNNFSYITKALASTTGWENSSTNCAVGNLPSLNNSTGFGAVPAGYCGYDSYPNFATIAFFWIATETSSEGACNRDISYANAHLYQTGAYKYCGHSVRCLRDSVSCGDTVPPLFHGTLPDGHVCPENGRYHVPDFTTYFTDETVSDNSYPFSSLTVSQNPAAGTEIDTETEVTITLSDPCGNGSLYYVDVIPTYSPDTFMAFSVCENELPVSFEFDGITFSFAEEGTQTVVLNNVWECGRTVTVNLIVIQTTTVEVDTVVCADSLPIFWNGVNFTEARTYYDTLTTVNGCDSVVVMMLNVSDCRPLEYGQHFPYDVSVETVSGHCYDDGHLIINLLDNNGNVIQIDPQTHNAVNTVQYPLYNVRYHYQNISDGGLQYDYNHDIILMAGTYCVGVTAKIPSPNGGYMQVDTTFCNVQVTTTYDHLEATALSNVAYDNNGDVERYGFRASFHCADVGRIQLRIIQGSFPYTVTILDEQQDTVRHTVFYQRANSGNNPYAASYRDYYTFDSLAIGTYSINVSDSCGYTVPLTFSIPDYEPARYLALVESNLSGCLDETVVPFRVERRYPSGIGAIWCNYNYSYMDSILMYRFINPGGDTTEWKNIVTPGYAATWVLVNDTFPSYCNIFYDTIKMQLHDLCHDTLMTYSFRFLPQFGFSDSIVEVYQQDTIIHDTCATHLPNGVSTQTYKIWGSTWTGAGKTIYGSAYSANSVPFRYYRCPLSYNIWSLPDSTLLGHDQSDEFTGLGTWETFFADTSLHVYVSVTDAQGCTLADKDTVLVYQTEPVDELLFWYECHNDKDDDGKDHCCADRYLWIQEHGVEADTFRRNMTLRLIESPLYNQFNFTAIRQDGVWTVTPDDPNNHSTYLEFSYEDGWRATVRDSVCLPPGRYTFEVSTDCGVDTITYSWAGYYYDTLDFVSAPQYEIQQLCGDMVFTQISTGLVNYMYFIDPEVSNDIPEETIPNYACSSYSPQGGSNYRDSQGRNVLVFSIPGTYVITNYAYNWPYSNCTDWCGEYHYYYDTITVAFSYVDLDMASALLCDQSSPTGIVSAKAVNGNAPYTYTLYDQWNATGNVVATNSTGFFDNVPMTVGQHFSVQVTDSCQISFSVNLTATVLSHGSLVWDEVASSRPHCAGDTVQLTAMNFPPPATYHWTGPNGFSSTSPTVDVVLPDYSENGWYIVEILNSNICGKSLVDSILVPMAPNPQVTITGGSICSEGSTTLQATSSVAESGYLWNTGDTTPSINVTPEQGAIYSVTVTNTLTGCAATASQIIELRDSVPPVFHGTLPDGHVCPENGRYYVPDFTSYFAEETVSDNSYPFSSLTVSQNPAAGTEMYSDAEVTITLADPCGNESSYSVAVVRLYWSGVEIDTAVCESELPITWNDVTFTEAGTQTVTLQNAVGCDSVVTLNLTVLQPTVTVLTDTVIENNLPYVLNGHEYFYPGTYIQNIVNVFGCDSTIYLILNVIGNISDTIGWTVCNSFEWNGITYTQSGDYTQYFSTVYGSDSVVTLHLTVHYSDTTEFYQTSCYSYTWNDETYTETGNYTQILTDIYGCDSIVTLRLHIDTTVRVNISDSICYGNLYNSLGFNLTANVDTTVSDIMGSSISGCDSIVTLHLTVLHSTDTVLTATVNENDLPFICGNSSFYATGSYTVVIPNAVGCDSTIYLNLTVNHNVVADIDSTVCESLLPVVWNDSVFTAAGTKTTTILASTGADSTVVMTLNVLPTTYDVLDISIVENDLPFILNGDEYSSAGTFTQILTNWNGCDSILTVNLAVLENVSVSFDTIICGSFVWNGITYTQSGDYTQYFSTVYGSDSVVTLHLTTLATPTVTVTATDTVLCVGGTAMLHAEVTPAGAEYGYQWYKDNVPIQGAVTADYFASEGARDSAYHYTVTVSSVMGCDVTASAPDITFVFDPIVEVSINHNASCMGSTATLAAEVECAVPLAAFTYNWYRFSANAYNPNSTELVGTTAELSTTGNELGGIYAYWVTVSTMDQGCSSTSEIVSHTVIPDPVVTIAVANGYPTEVCDGGSTAIEADVSGGYGEITYQWYKNGDLMAGDTSQTLALQNLAYGVDDVYTVEVTQTGVGCANSVSAALDTLVTVASSASSFSVTACDSYFWNGVTYNTSGIYVQHFQTSLGCDSTVTLHLTVNHSVTELVEVTACDSYSWNGVTYNTSGIYVQQFQMANGCDSTVTLHLTVNHSVTELVEVTACDSYVWDDSVYTQSGDYVRTFTNTEGCDSVVTLHLTLKHSETAEYAEMACDSYIWNGITYSHSGDYVQTFTNADGCDSVVTLHLTLKYSEMVDYADTVCDSYFWNDSVCTQSGDYVRTFTNSEGCDSIVTLHLTVNHSVTELVEVTACDSYVWNGVTYTESGDYSLYQTATSGCDSIVTLHLTINHPDTVIFPATACNSYNWNDVTYTESGDYMTYLTNNSGCALVLVLRLTVNHSDTTDLYATACDSYTWNDEIYTENGHYSVHLTNAAGCDSTVTLHLTVNHSVTELVEVTACDSYTWNGVTYTESGDYTNYLTTVDGCDSTVTIHLTINHSVTELVEVTACDSYTWNGETYTESGVYSVNLNTASGCDSLVTLQLTIHYSDTIDFYATACGSYNWNGEVYVESGDYVNYMTNAAGCDLVTILHLTIYETEVYEFSVTTSDSCYTWNGITYCHTGDYTQTFQAVTGCDSVVTLHLVITVGIDNMDGFDFKVYPNPTGGVVNVQCTKDNGQVETMDIQVFDAYGRYLRTVPVIGEITQVDLVDYAAGIYFVKAVVDGQIVAVRKVVRE